MSWEKDDAWSKKPGPRRPRGRGRATKADRAENAEAGSSVWEDSRRKAEKRTKRRRIGWIVGGIALTLLILVALLPTIAGVVAPGFIAGAGSNAIAGRVGVERARFSWFGAQRIEGITLYDTDNTKRGDLDITIDKGLLGLALAGGDYGTITLAGSLDASNNNNGEPFTEHTLKPIGSPAPTKPTPAGPTALPKGLRVTLELDDLQIQYADPARTDAGGPVEAIRLDDLSGTIAIDAEGESAIDLAGVVTRKLAGAALFDRAGELSINATARDLTNDAGELTPARAAIDSTLRAEGIESSIAELFADLRGRAPDALGETISLTMTARGTGDALATSIGFTSDAATLNAPLTLNLDARTVAASAPISATIDTERLSYLMPDRAAFTGAGPDAARTEITAFPTITLTIDRLALPIPEPGETTPGLKNAAVLLRAEVGRLAASVPLPAAGESPGSATRSVTIEPTTITLNTGDAPEPATLTASFPTTIDGMPAGSLTVDLSAHDWRETGTIGLRNIDGAVRADRLAIAPFQPFAAAVGLSLTELLGETTDLAIEARPDPDDASTTRFTINASAPRANAAGVLTLSGGILRSAGEPISLHLDRPDAAIVPLLDHTGIRVTGASGLAVTLSEVALDLDALADGTMPGTAFRITAGLARIDAAIDGTAASAGSPTTASITGFTADLRTDNLADGLRLALGTALRLDNTPAGAIESNLTIADLLDRDGAFKTGLPEDIRGTVEFEGVRTAALNAFVPVAQLDLPADIGPVVDVTLTATPGDGATPGTRLALAVKSEKLNGTADALVTQNRIIGVDEAINFELTGIGPLLSRVASPSTPGLAFSGDQRLRLSARGLDLPIGAADPASAKANFTLGLRSIGIRKDGKYAGSIRSFDAIASLEPGTAPTLEIKGDVIGRDGVYTAGERVIGTIEGAFTLSNAYSPIDTQGRLVLAPNGSITARDIPITFARLSQRTFPGKDGAEDGAAGTTLLDALHNAVGQAVSFTLETARRADTPNPAETPLRVTVETVAGPHTLDAELALTPNAEGGFTISDLSADGLVTLNDPTVRTLLAIAAPAAPRTITVVKPGTLSLKARNDRGTLRLATNLAPTTLSGLPTTNPETNAGTASAPPAVLDPLTLAGLANASVPIAMLADPAAAHAVSFNADLKGTDTRRPDTPVLTLVASADTTIAGGTPAGPLNAELRLDSNRVAWIDALAGMSGMLTDALGDRVRLESKVTAAFDPNATPATPTSLSAAASLNSPTVRMASPAAVTLRDNTLSLDTATTIAWTMTPELFASLAPTEPGKAAQATLASPTQFLITAMRFHLPLDRGRARPLLDLKLEADALPLRFADGSTYTLTDLNASLRPPFEQSNETGDLRLVASASTRETPDSKAITIDATVAGLPPRGAEFDPTDLTIDGIAKIDDLPMPLVDALANADGQLVTLLGPTLDMDATLRGLPQRQGTINFRATTPQSRARYDATVRPHPRDNALSALITNEPTTATITHFDFDFGGKKIGMLPVFGGVRKVQDQHRPASVSISQLITPVDGDTKNIIMKGTVDPGVVQYEFERGLAALLEATNQRTMSNAGERLEPFNIAMDRGVASFDSLRIPLGEFVLSAEGSFDLERQYEDITLGIPAGAFAGEAIGNLPGATGGLLNKDIIVPVRRRGPMGADNKWEPDFEAVIKQLFSPENILDNVIKGGLKDILGGG